MHKKILIAIGITILFLGTCITPSIAIDNVKKSSNPISSGNTLYVGGSGPNNYTYIQDAIDNASDGDTVYVYDDSSPYYENVEVDKSINLIGEDRNTTVIDGSGYGYAVAIDADGVVVTGFTICNIGYPDSIGIDLNSDNNLISDNIIKDNIYAIDVGSVRNNIIQRNKIVYNEVGIYTQDWFSGAGNNNLFTWNFIAHNSWYGIYDDDRDGGTIVTWNVIADNGVEPKYWPCGILKHDSYSIYHHNDFLLNYYYHVIMDGDRYGNTWDNGYEGNFWDDWNENPGYPDTYIIDSEWAEEIDYHPSATPYRDFIVVRLSEYRYYALVDEPIEFYAEYNKDSDSVSWLWEFGDGTISNLTEPSHSYSKPGKYQINVTVTDNQGNSDTDKSTAYIGVPPDTPLIDGPTKCNRRTSYNYIIVSNDSDGGNLYYYIHWGDGYHDWVGPYPAGEEVIVSHCWNYSYTYTVSVRAIDEADFKSDWATLEVTVPRRTRALSYHWLLEHFPLLERLLTLLLL